MELHKAISKAVKFCNPKDERVPVLGSLRLFPRYNGAPARVSGTSGNFGILINVNSDVPDSMVSGKDILQAAKQSIVGAEIKEGWLRLWTGPDSVFDLSLQPSEGWPSVPQFPDSFYDLDGMVDIQKVMHAAGGKDVKTSLQVINFKAGILEATDSFRFARVYADSYLRGQIPTGVFQLWPKGMLGNYGVQGEYIWVWCGDELRWGRFVTTPFPELNTIFPEWHQGAWRTVDTQLLYDSVKQAVSVAHDKSIMLGFNTKVTVQAWTKDNTTKTFEAHIPAKMGCTESSESYVKMVFIGKYLLNALKVINTPKVRLCYTTPDKPLRLESGNYLEIIMSKI